MYMIREDRKLYQWTAKVWQEWEKASMDSNSAEAPDEDQCNPLLCKLRELSMRSEEEYEYAG